MSFAFFPPIIVQSMAMEMTTAKRQALPIRQSKRNMRMSMAMNMEAVPTMSARLWARRVSVSEAALSSLFRKRPEPLESKKPREVFIRWAMPRFLMFDAVLKAARWVHMRAAK